MVDATKSANTPPVDLPARKIMRRGDETKSGTNTTANSENPSKATSETDGSDGGNDGGNKSKDKSALTREEREARYREARQRIFGNVQSDENESLDAATSTEEKDASRSSSASGKRKNKKQRNFDDDDGFEARSRYNAYYPGQYATSGYTGDGTVYYSGFPGPAPNPQFTPMHPNASPPLGYSNGYSSMMPQDAQSQYAWSSQQYQPSNETMMQANYGPMQNGYDISTDFQRGMQSFQSAGMLNQMTPKMANASMAGYQDTYAQPPSNLAMNSGWPQQSAYPMPQGPFGATGPGNRPMSAPTQAPVQGVYPYGQFPPPNYNGKPSRNQHPIPGSYQRQQFNPQSQAFVPGGRNMPFQMSPNMGVGPPQVMTGYGGHAMPVSSQLPPQMQRPSPPTVNTQVFGSPHIIHSNNLIPSNLNSSPSSHMLPAVHGPSQQNSVPVQSSIAKYGTPSNLPARPPPTQQQAPKFSLPGSTLAPATRVISNPTSPYLGNSAQPVPIQGGSGNN
jgi:hypothetical protein